MGLGLKAIQHGYRVLFTAAAAMIGTLTKAMGEGWLEDKLKLYTIPRLLIVDEIGYLWVKKTARGFRNVEHFKTAIYFHCGGLDLYPH